MCEIPTHLSYSVVCLTTGPKHLPKRLLHIVRSKASSFKWEYPLLSLRSSSSFLRLLPRLLVTSISPFIFHSITCFRRQFLRKMWPIQLAFRFRISRRIFLCGKQYPSLNFRQFQTTRSGYSERVQLTVTKAIKCRSLSRLFTKLQPSIQTAVIIVSPRTYRQSWAGTAQSL